MMNESDSKTQRSTGVLTRPRGRLKRPPLFRVLLHNDDYTTREFVVRVLQTIFHKDFGEATQIMLTVHNSGVGVCGIYPKEVAETKVFQVEKLARNHEYPLLCTMEAD